MTDFELLDQLRQRWTDIGPTPGHDDACECGHAALEWLAIIETTAIERYPPDTDPENVASATLHDLATGLAYGLTLVQEQQNMRDQVIQALTDSGLVPPEILKLLEEE